MILLDTCALLWMARGDARLSPLARSRIVAHAGSVFVSAISAFEVGIAVRKGRVSLPKAPDRWYEGVLLHHGLNEVAVSGVIAARSTLLPPLHADPADRILVATAQEHGWTILTPDTLVRSYPNVRVEW